MKTRRDKYIEAIGLVLLVLLVATWFLIPWMFDW